MASSYVQPVKGTVRRFDEGIDYQGKAGDPVVAIGRARVDYVKSDPGGFGKAVYYTLLDGPMKGRQIYVGHAQPTVHAGEVVAAGVAVATLLTHGLGNAGNLAGWTEIGFAKGGAPLANSSKSFQAFVATLTSAAPSAPSPSAAPTSATSNGAADLPQLPDPFAGQLPVAGGLSSAGPLAPGAVPADGLTPKQVAENWQTVASMPDASPETLALLRNAQLAAGG